MYADRDLPFPPERLTHGSLPPRANATPALVRVLVIAAAWAIGGVRGVASAGLRRGTRLWRGGHVDTMQRSSAMGQYE